MRPIQNIALDHGKWHAMYRMAFWMAGARRSLTNADHLVNQINRQKSNPGGPQTLARITGS
ncbi:MAG: hypothetical protein IPJ71_00295 [Bdellovibrionales bacterium]|nr:hypothetical protein [Bdellovibrionales bacterium]